MRIAIVGPGAMGNLFCHLLSKSEEADLWLLDHQQERVKKTGEEGLFVEGVSGDHHLRPKITLNPDAIGPVDLVILCVKGPDTYEACMNARSLFGSETSILTLQNGLGNLEEIERAIGPGRALGGTTSMGATALGLNRIRHAGWGEIVIGEEEGKKTLRADKILRLFKACGLEASFTDNLAGLLWSKLIINVGINALTVLTRLHNGQLIRHDGTRAVMDKAVTEAVKVAQALRITLLYDTPVEKVAGVCEATAGNIASMLQDFLKEKRTEVNQINGVVVREGTRLGIQTPVNEVLLYLVQTLEESYGNRVIA